jgi:hypothetical protein
MSALESPDHDGAAPETSPPGGAPAAPGADWVTPAAGGRPPTGVPAWAVGAAVLVGSAIVLAVLARPGARPAPTASGGSAAAPSSGGASATGAATVPAVGWTTANTARWTGGQRRSLAYELEAANTVAVWLKHVRPVLVVRCLGNHTDAFVFTDAPARIEPEPDARTVRVSLDGEPLATEHWLASAGHDGLFAPDGARFAGRLAAAGQLRFGFTPQNAEPVVATFDLTGADRMVQQVSAACRHR